MIKKIKINIYLKTIIFLLLYNSVNGQDSSSVKIIENIIKEKQNNAKIIYVDTALNAYKYNDIIKTITKNKIVGIDVKTKMNSIVLSVEEKKYIQKELEKSIGFTWPDNLFVNSKKISSNEIKEVLNDFKKNQSHLNERVWQSNMGVY